MEQIIFWVFVAYTLLLFGITFITARKADSGSFFAGNKKSPWFVVAYGAIGASLSGVTFMSVPGWVEQRQFTYMLTVLGYLLGYVLIAFVSDADEELFDFYILHAYALHGRDDSAKHMIKPLVVARVLYRHDVLYGLDNADELFIAVFVLADCTNRGIGKVIAPLAMIYTVFQFHHASSHLLHFLPAAFQQP